MSERPQPSPEHVEAAIVVRFTATDITDAQKILEEFNRSVGDRHPAAWMCIRESLETLNETLSSLGWPPSPTVTQGGPQEPVDAPEVPVEPQDRHDATEAP